MRELTDTENKHLQELSIFLNGQLRGGINKKAQEINLDLIQMTMGRIFEDAFIAGYKEGVNDMAENQINEDLKSTIKDIIKDDKN